MDEQVDQACERRRNVEIKPELLAQLQDKLTNGVYRFSPIWHISSVKITRVLDDVVPFSNNGRQQWP